MDSSQSDSATFSSPPPPSLDPPSTGHGGLGLGLSRRQVPVSPYLNFDPRVVSPANESPWIFPDGSTTKPQRGIFEMAFSEIGCSIVAGASIGGVIGLNNGLKAIAGTNTPFAIKRATLLNHITRNGSSTSSTLASIAVIFASIGCILNWGFKLDDHISTVASATSTGLLYGFASDPDKNNLFKKAGLTVRQVRVRRSAAGGIIGLAASLLYVLSDKPK